GKPEFALNQVMWIQFMHFIENGVQVANNHASEFIQVFQISVYKLEGVHLATRY
ncbi:MAG: hypothetical protein RI909_1411, partial [Bacteroidota bacterium]